MGYQADGPGSSDRETGPFALIILAAVKLLGGVGAGRAAGGLALLVLLVLRLSLYSAVGHGVLAGGRRGGSVLGEHCHTAEKREAERSDHDLFH
jgi:hypothetical protein